MSKQWQLRRGTKAENDIFTGAEGEVTMCTDTKGLRVHDGTTQGGFDIDTVVAFQLPTADNNYTWYRKYASGWVEQGGIKETGTTTINFPVAMANTAYWYIAKGNYNNTQGSYASSADCVLTKNTTNMVLSTGGLSVCWQVSGLAA